MDTAVALVQAYLHINGYFTVCEYPVVEQRGRKTRSATDIDVLAFRYPGAGRELRQRGRRRVEGVVRFAPDPGLGAPDTDADMIVGEVKEGRAHFNEAAHDPLVIAAALARFGCCRPDHARVLAQQIVEEGSARTHHGHVVRMVAFGGRGEPREVAGRQRVSLEHVVGFLTAWLEEEWGTLHATQLKQPGLDVLALLHKCGWSARSGP